MALISCPECGKQISDQADACNNCGFPISKTAELQNPDIVTINGTTINLRKVWGTYGYNRAEAVKFIARQADITISEAKPIMEDYCNNVIKNMSFLEKGQLLNEMSSLNKKETSKDRVKQLKKDKVPFCPKCKSTSITFIKKTSIGKAIFGGIMLGDGGTVLGGQSGTKGKIKCLNCGHTWKI